MRPERIIATEDDVMNEMPSEEEIVAIMAEAAAEVEAEWPAIEAQIEAQIAAEGPRIFRPAEVMETEDDVMLVFECYCGTQMAELTEMAEEAHPRLFEDCEERAAFRDADDNIFLLDTCRPSRMRDWGGPS